MDDSPLNSSLECSGQFGLGGQVVLGEPDMSWSVGLQMKRNNSKEGLELKYYKKALFFYVKKDTMSQTLQSEMNYQTQSTKFKGSVLALSSFAVLNVMRNGISNLFHPT